MVPMLLRGNLLSAFLRHWRGVSPTAFPRRSVGTISNVFSSCRLARCLGAWFRPAGRVTFSRRGKSNQKRFAPASGPALRYGFVHYAAVPRVAVQGPSMALYGSRRIPAARPSPRRLRSPSWRGVWSRL